MKSPNLTKTTPHHTNAAQGLAKQKTKIKESQSPSPHQRDNASNHPATLHPPPHNTRLTDRHHAASVRRQHHNHDQQASHHQCGNDKHKKCIGTLLSSQTTCRTALTDPVRPGRSDPRKLTKTVQTLSNSGESFHHVTIP